MLGGAITTNATNADGDNIDIVARDRLHLIHGEITADALLVSLESVISASSQFGTNGVVAIDSPEVDLAGTLSALPASFLDAAALLRQRCAQRAEAGAGSFVVAGTSAIDASPDAPLEASSDGALGVLAPGATLTGMVLGEDAGGRKIGMVVECVSESGSS